MNFLQKLSNYFFGKPKIESGSAPVAAEQTKHTVTPMFIRPEDTKQQEVAPQQPTPQVPVEYPSKEIKIEIKEAPAPEGTITVVTSTAEVTPEPKKKRTPTKKKSTAKKK